MQKLKYIDIFAGCGGISLGLFNSQKWEGVFAIEKSAFAFSTLKYNLIEKNNHFNWPSWLPIQNHDINELIEQERINLEQLKGTIDLVVGGPPCQGFSVAGKRREGDERNKLFNSYLKFIQLVEPETILFENVKGFDMGFKKGPSADRGIPYSHILRQKLRDMGYKGASYDVLNFKDYGVPQTRERVVVAASKKFQGVDFFKSIERRRTEFLAKKGLTDNVTIKDAISDLMQSNGIIDSPDSVGFKAGTYGNVESSFQQLMKNGKSPEYPDSHRFANHTPEVRRKFATIIEKKLTSKEVREIFGTKKSRTKLLMADQPSQTLTTLPDDYVHYCEPRILTVREYARIQSFDDWYEIKEKYTTGGHLRKIQVPRYSQIGNAVPPLFAELSGSVIYDLLKNG
jgi:DNA (cytosine-5)-methyltransferase 1